MNDIYMMMMSIIMVVMIFIIIDIDDGIIICIDMVLDRFNSYMRVFHKPNLLGEKSYFVQGF